jgi:dephospho-CoA kinase
MFRIGLTGGVGCGKSTVSRYLAKHGIPIIDGDEISREAVMPGSPVMREIERLFGSEMLTEDGNLNREKMAELVFSDEGKRQILNGLIHPFVWKKTEEATLAAQETGHRFVVLDMPLLLEIGWNLRVESVWVVTVPQEVQIERVQKRDGVTREQAMARIRKQMPTASKIGYADIVIDNSGTEEETYRRVDEALAEIGFFEEKE